MAICNKSKVRKRGARKPETSHSRLFTYSLPVHLTLQFTFRESEILIANEEDPEISKDAITELKEELTAYIRQNYVVGECKVLVDAPDISRQSVIHNELGRPTKGCDLPSEPKKQLNYRAC